MRKLFSITEPFRFEENDLRALIQVMNVLLIMIIGLKASWIGLSVAIFNTIQALYQHKHINDMIINLSLIALNVYFLTLLYC